MEKTVSDEWYRKFKDDQTVVPVVKGVSLLPQTIFYNKELMNLLEETAGSQYLACL